MRGVLRALVALSVLAPLCATAAGEKVTIELNTAEPADNRCRMNFVVENKAEAALDSMKLDFVVFGTDGGIMRRLILEMGPARPLKTIVKTYLVDTECTAISAMLVNDGPPVRPQPRPRASTGSRCRRG